MSGLTDLPPEPEIPGYLRTRAQAAILNLGILRPGEAFAWGSDGRLRTVRSWR